MADTIAAILLVCGVALLAVFAVRFILRAGGAVLAEAAHWQLLSRRFLGTGEQELSIEVSIGNHASVRTYRGRGTVWYVKTQDGWKRAGTDAEYRIVELVRTDDWKRA